jgi:GlpG protein
MRQAGTLPPDADAERFADYLLTLGIKTRIDAGNNGRIVWIKDEQDLERGRHELAEFLANRADPKYRMAQDGARAIRQDLEAKEKQYRKNLMDVRRGWAQPITGRAPITMTLMGLSIAVALTSLLTGGAVQPREFLQITSLDRFLQVLDSGAGVTLTNLVPELLHGQIWRLITPIFVHFGPLHIIFNLLMLQNMGTLLETREGTHRFVWLVLVAAVLSNVAQLCASNLFDMRFLLAPLTTGIHQNPNFGGMSGVNYALFGYIWLRSRGGLAGYMIHPNTVFMMLGWLVVCMTGMLGGVANTAHVVGLLVGMAAAQWVNRSS